MKKLLVPCDFSRSSIHALQFALDVATHARTGTVHVLHVVELPVLHDTVLMPVLSFEEALLQELKEKAEKEFIQLEKKYNKDGIKMITEVKFGKIADTIRRYAIDNHIDLVIMGSHGATGAREVFVGSNAEKVVRQSGVPVLVIKNQYKGPVKNIVFPNALNPETQEDLVERVKELQHFFNSNLHIVWINTPVNFHTDAETRQRLEHFVKRYKLRNYKLHVYNHLNTEDGITEFSRSIDADLIAIGTRGKTGLAHLVHGSLTESLVNHTNQMVWTSVMKDEPVTA